MRGTNFLSAAAVALILGAGTTARAQENEADTGAAAPLGGYSIDDPQRGLLGQVSAWLFYSSEFGVTGGASGTFRLSPEASRWVSLSGELA